MSSPPSLLAKHISSRQVTRQPADTSCPDSTIPSLISFCTALNALRKYSGSFTVGAHLPTRFSDWKNAEPPNSGLQKLKSMCSRVVLASFANTGEIMLRTSLTCPPADTITVPGDMIFSPLGYCCASESESFPVGTFIFNAQQKSLSASTPS